MSKTNCELHDEQISELEAKLREMEAVYVQLDHESHVEPLTERRVRMLKAQLFQAERQMLLMTNARSNDKQKLDNAERALHHVHNYFTSLSADAEKAGKRSAMISLSDIKRETEILEDGISQIHSNQDIASSKQGDRFFPKTFLKQKNGSVATSDMICGNLDHIHLSNVTKLEHQLAKLYGEIHSVLHRGEGGSFTDTSDHIKHTENLMRSLEKSCQDLMELSILVPTAPWGKRFVMPEMTIDDIMKAFPKLTNSKHEQVKGLVTCILKLCDHRYLLIKNKSDRLEAELSLVQSKDQTVTDYTERISEQFISQFRTYQEDLSEQLISPLSELLVKFSDLSECPTDERLKNFLSDFKEHLPEFQRVCEAINLNTDNQTHNLPHGDTFTKQLRKTLKKMSLNNTRQIHSMEDTDNELRYMERDTLDELSYLKQQIIESSSKDDSQTNRSAVSLSPTKLPMNGKPANKKPVTKKLPRTPQVLHKEWDNSTAIDDEPSSAEMFLAKLDQTQQLENYSPRLTVTTKDHIKTFNNGRQSSEPSWLQEMKQELNSETNPDRPGGDSSNAIKPASRNRAVNGVPMSKLNLVRKTGRR